MLQLDLIGGRQTCVSEMSTNSQSEMDGDGFHEGDGLGVSGVVGVLLTDLDGRIFVSGALSTAAGASRRYGPVFDLGFGEERSQG